MYSWSKMYTAQPIIWGGVGRVGNPSGTMRRAGSEKLPLVESVVSGPPVNLRGPAVVVMILGLRSPVPPELELNRDSESSGQMTSCPMASK